MLTRPLFTSNHIKTMHCAHDTSIISVSILINVLYLSNLISNQSFCWTPYLSPAYSNFRIARYSQIYTQTHQIQLLLTELLRPLLAAPHTIILSTSTPSNHPPRSISLDRLLSKHALTRRVPFTPPPQRRCSLGQWSIVRTLYAQAGRSQQRGGVARVVGSRWFRQARRRTTLLQARISVPGRWRVPGP